MGVSKLYLLTYNGEYYAPRQDLAVPHLSEEALYRYLLEFTKYGSYIKLLQVIFYALLSPLLYSEVLECS